jgi:hypothetical protein
MGAPSLEEVQKQVIGWGGGNSFTYFKNMLLVVPLQATPYLPPVSSEAFLSCRQPACWLLLSLSSLAVSGGNDSNKQQADGLHNMKVLGRHT